MTTITYDTAARVSAEAPVTAPAGQRKGWFSRAFARMIEARQKQAMNEIRRYGISLPRDVDKTAR